MPYKDPELSKRKTRERKQAWQTRERNKRIAAGFPADSRGRHGNHARGAKSHLWSESKLLDHDGYILIRVGKSHPLADPHGYARESLLVWVSAGNPLPNKNELLHHKSEEKTDDRIENLELKTRGGHNSHHNAIRGRDDKGRFLLDGRTWEELSE